MLYQRRTRRIDYDLLNCQLFFKIQISEVLLVVNPDQPFRQSSSISISHVTVKVPAFL